MKQIINQTFSINLSDLSKDYLLQNDFKYALIYYLNDVVVGKIDEIEEINKDVLYEAMFFNKDKELHFFEDNGYKGVLTERNDCKAVEYKSITYTMKNKNGKEEEFTSDIVSEGDVIYERYLLKEKLGRDSRVNDYKYIKVANYLGYDEHDGQAYIQATCLCGLEKRVR